MPTVDLQLADQVCVLHVFCWIRTYLNPLWGRGRCAGEIGLLLQCNVCDTITREHWIKRQGKKTEQ